MLRAAVLALGLIAHGHGAAAQAAPPPAAWDLSALPEGVAPEDICRTGAGALPHLGQLWPAATLSRLTLHDRRGAGLRGLLAAEVPSPEPSAPDFMVMEIARPGPFDGAELWLRLRPSDRLRAGDAGDVWLRYATDNVVDADVRRVLAELPPAIRG